MTRDRSAELQAKYLLLFSGNYNQNMEGRGFDSQWGHWNFSLT